MPSMMDMDTRLGVLDPLLVMDAKASEMEERVIDEKVRELDDMGVEELKNVMEDKYRANEAMVLENTVFLNHLKRVAPHALERSPSADSLEGRPRRQGRGKARNKERAALTLEQKTEVAAAEQDDLSGGMTKIRTQGEKLIDSLKASIEEAENAIAELKKENYEFRRDIVQGAVNPRTGKVMAERVVRYFEEKARAKDALMEKLRLKNATLRRHISKTEHVLRQKEEMGEGLHAIDFDQLKIENKQYQERIEDRNQELLRLKLTAGNTVQVLNAFKKKLHALTQESGWLRSEISQRSSQMEHISEEKGKAKKECVKAEALNTKLKQRVADFQVPCVLDYVKQNADIYDLEKRTKDWERKVEIAQMSLKRQRALFSAAKHKASSSTAARGFHPRATAGAPPSGDHGFGPTATGSHHTGF